MRRRFKLFLVCRTKRLWIPQAQAVISVMLAGQLPCFLVTESNMQHPQKKAMGFCLPFLVRHLWGPPWPQKNHHWDWLAFVIKRERSNVRPCLLFYFTFSRWQFCYCLSAGDHKTCAIKLCGRIKHGSRNNWRDLSVTSLYVLSSACKHKDYTFQISWSQTTGNPALD